MKMMMKLVVAAVVMVTMAGCYDAKNVPPATKGKLLTVDGYQEGFLDPGRHRLSWSYFGRELVLLSTSVFTRNEPMNMILADKLTLNFNVRTRMTLKRDPQVLEGVFDALTPVWDEELGAKTISLANIYQTYAEMTIQQQARAIMSGYTVEEVQANYARISGEMFVAVRDALAGTPLQVQEVTLNNIKYPDVVTKAVELAKQRELEITQVENEAQKEMIEAQKELEIANARREIELVRARTQRDANRIIGEGVTPEFLMLRQLEVQQAVQTAMAENGATTFMPFEALDEIGTSIRMFNDRN